MTEDEWQDLTDLYLDDALPSALRVLVEARMTGDPEIAHEVNSLRATHAKLQGAPSNRPDQWFVEHALDRLLRDHNDAASAASLINEPNR